MPNPKPDAEFREISAESIVLRDADGHVRARLETGPPGDGDERPHPAVRIVLMSAGGDPAVTIEVGNDGVPKITVGPPAGASAVTIEPDAVSLWHGGNAVACIASTPDGGTLETADGDGKAVVEMPVT